MKISRKFTARVAEWLISRVANKRMPDFVVGADNPSGAYLNRWYLTPWTRTRDRLRDRVKAEPTLANKIMARLIGLLPNLYLYQFLHDDDDRALHDHPSWAVSYILRGAYIEHTIAAGGIHHRTAYRTAYRTGSLRFLGTRFAHRIDLHRQRERFTNDADNAFFKRWESRRSWPGVRLMHPIVTGGQKKCWCLTCWPMTVLDPASMRMALCPTCGNKRCPKANFHEHACTGSNEVGQPGSSWEHVKPWGPESGNPTPKGPSAQRDDGD